MNKINKNWNLFISFCLGMCTVGYPVLGQVKRKARPIEHSDLKKARTSLILEFSVIEKLVLLFSKEHQRAKKEKLCLSKVQQQRIAAKVEEKEEKSIDGGLNSIGSGFLQSLFEVEQLPAPSLMRRNHDGQEDEEGDEIAAFLKEQRQQASSQEPKERG